MMMRAERVRELLTTSRGGIGQCEPRKEIIWQNGKMQREKKRGERTNNKDDCGG